MAGNNHFDRWADFRLISAIPPIDLPNHFVQVPLSIHTCRMDSIRLKRIRKFIYLNEILLRRFIIEYPYIKNITHEKVQSLAGLVNAEDGQIVSKTLAQNEAVSVTLFAFAKGEEISTHDSTGDAMVTVLEGTGRFTVDGVEHLVHAGEVLVMPAKKPHAVYAPEAFKWMLTVVFPFK